MFRTLRPLCLGAVLLVAGNAIGKTYYVAGQNPAASDDNPGSETLPWRTISRAAQALEPGDTVLIGSGVYRERVSPARGGASAEAPITYRAAAGATPVIKGSDVWKPAWKPVEAMPGVFSARLEESLFSQYETDDEPALIATGNPFKTRISISNGQDKMVKPTTGLAISLVARPDDEPPFPQVLGQIYVDGDPLVQAAGKDELARTPRSFFVGAQGDEILLHWPADAPPLADVTFEITTRARIFAPKIRGLGYIHLEGLHFEHAANQGPFPQVGAVSVRSGHDWIIRGCRIRYAQTLGLDVGGEFFDDRLRDGNPRSSGHIIEGNTITDNGLCGIAGYNCHDVRISGNRIERNNRLGFIQGLNASWEEYAGIKILGSRQVLVADNLVQQNGAFGIWFDNQWAGSRITRNLVLQNQMAGIFIELGNAPEAPLLVDNNVVAYTSGHGIYCHDASDVVIAHNLSYRNSDWGIWLWTISPRGDPGGCSNNQVRNNIVFGNGAGAISLPFPGKLNENNSSDYNLVDSFGTFIGIKPAAFQLNLTQGKYPAKKRDLIAAVLDTYQKYNIPPSRRLSEELLNQQPITFDLDLWRLVSGNDRHSRTGPFQKSFLRTGVPDFECVLGEGYTPFCQAVPGVSQDYFGAPIPAAACYPGPFQAPRVDPAAFAIFEKFSRNKEGNLFIETQKQTGRNRFILWPKSPIPSPGAP